MTTAEAIREAMEKYNEYRAKWEAVNGKSEASEAAFHAWFTNQLRGGN